MKKLTLFTFFICSCCMVFPQPKILAFKKHNKVLVRFWQGSVIAFLQKNNVWQKGTVTDIRNDSFFIRPEIVRYSLLRSDTSHYAVMGFALTNIYAMPKKGYLIDYKNGHWEINGAGGNVRWLWIKAGWIFRTMGAGYAALNIANGLLKNEFTLKGSKLGIAAAVFAFGMLLKYTYKHVLVIGKKYHLEIQG